MFITVYRDLFTRFLIVFCLSLPVCLWLLELLVCLGLLECLGLLLLLLCLGLLKCLGVFESLGLPPRCGSCGLPLCGCGWCSRDLVLFTEISGSCRTEDFWSPRCGSCALPLSGCGWCSPGSRAVSGNFWQLRDWRLLITTIRITWACTLRLRLVQSGSRAVSGIFFRAKKSRDSLRVSYCGTFEI